LVQFAQALHFNHLNSVYNALDFSGPLDFVRRARRRFGPGCQRLVTAGKG